MSRRVTNARVIAVAASLFAFGSFASAQEEPRRLAAPSAFGIYAGTPSGGGLFAAGPIDGPIGARMGLTGFPNLGILWTPGIEVRPGQESGTMSTSGPYGFGNLFFGYQKGAETEEKRALESGLGYRWFLSDRRGKRWVLGFEAGGYWRSRHALPVRPTVRLIFMLASR